MDINMPEMNGYEASNIIKKRIHEENRYPPMNIIACTAYAFNEEIIDIYGNGMDGYIEKPVDREKLLKILKDFNILT